MTSRSKHLFLLSDGFPQDYDYGQDRRSNVYGIRDTAAALREAEAAGVTPFCITVDKAGHDYLRQMCDESRYMVIEDIAALPRELPKIYQRVVRAPERRLAAARRWSLVAGIWSKNAASEHRARCRPTSHAPQTSDQRPATSDQTRVSRAWFWFPRPATWRRLITACRPRAGRRPGTRVLVPLGNRARRAWWSSAPTRRAAPRRCAT